jgi:GT2 family glycosyltransferase
VSQCLFSIAKHRPPADTIDLRVHVCDNGSTDGSLELVTREFPNVTLHSLPANSGFGAANNMLAARSQAEFLLLLNPDTIWQSDVVTPLLRELRANPSAVVAGPRLVYPDGIQQLSSQLLPSLRYELALAIRGTKLSKLPWFRGGKDLISRRRDLHHGVTTGAHPTEFVWATAWLVDRRWVGAHGLFRDQFAQYDEDLDFCFRLREQGQFALYVPSVEVIHIGGASSAPDKKSALMRTARATYYRTNHGRFASWAYCHLIVPLDRLRLKRLRRRETLVGQNPSGHV